MKKLFYSAAILLFACNVYSSVDSGQYDVASITGSGSITFSDELIEGEHLIFNG